MNKLSAGERLDEILTDFRIREDRHQFYWADFEHEFGNTAAMVIALGWAMVADPYEQAILFSAQSLMRRFGIGSLTAYVPDFRMIYCQQNGDNCKDYCWVVRWEYAGKGYETRVNLLENIVNLTYLP